MAESHANLLHIHNVPFDQRAHWKGKQTVASGGFNNESAHNRAGLGTIRGNRLQQPDSEGLACGKLLARPRYSRKTAAKGQNKNSQDKKLGIQTLSRASASMASFVHGRRISLAVMP